MLFKAESLQKDWLQMHTKVSQRVTNLAEAYRLASEEFWLPLSNHQTELLALKRKIDSLVNGTSAKYPLEPSAYEEQIEGLQKISKEIEESNERLNNLRSIGDKIIDLLIEEKARGESEKSILKNEINSSIRETAGIAKNLLKVCEKQSSSAKENLSIATKLQVRLKLALILLSKCMF